ncbi:MAG: aminopeptidase P family protein [Myxococcaceae bacterium]|nr:aminopeptidase P family protein [Myxococcaceae bacterium]
MGFHSRRQAVLAALRRPLVLFSGSALSRNYPANTFPFRADSNFLYFFERPEAGSAALFDPQDQTVTLFLPERTMADALWHGEVESFEAAKARHGVDRVLTVEALESHLASLAKGRQLDSVAVADFKATQRARAITGQDLQFDDPKKVGPGDVLDAIAALRLRKAPEELAEMRKTAVVTHEAHVAAMRASKPGVKEELLAGLVEGAFARSGCVQAYGTILSVRGEVLHNHDHGNTLQAGDVVLLDAGAENHAGYCSDVTRCWPVGGPFTPEGRDLYDLVLAAELHGIAQVKPGARYRDVHLSTCRVLAKGLVDLGLLSGTADALVESGAHAMFFPHGLGHQIGLDVHDLEAFGDRIHYPMGRQRSSQFGLAYLRMDLDLAEGMVFSIEPGLYFVPAILRNPEFRAKFKGQVNFDEAERYLAMNGGRGFGGIRIEDDVVCTASGAEVLTASIPKTRAELEALAGVGA